MMYYERIHKKISKEKYKQITKNMSDLEIMLTDRVAKKLKPEFADKFRNFGGGIMEYIRLQDSQPKAEYTEDDYDYYESDGHQLVILGSEETIKSFQKELNTCANRYNKL